MTAWLLETLVWTAVLIALVLMVRRPVARWFGPQVAYALWALPVLRLALPPIELPAWMAPASDTAPGALSDQFVFLDPDNLLATQDGVGVTEGAAPAAAWAVDAARPVVAAAAPAGWQATLRACLIRARPASEVDKARRKEPAPWGAMASAASLPAK